ncbi:MAG: chemotaxis protein CheW [Novosphingobium sp.]
MTAGMTELLLVAAIAGRRIALRAAEVHSVVELESLTPVPRAPAHIAGLSALRSRVLTVIDCRASLHLEPPAEAARKPQAAVVEVEGHLYALLVDGVEDVVEARSACIPLRSRLGRGWDRAALGMAEAEAGPLLLLSVAGIVAGPEEPGAVRAA